jgi:hypothetical protein
MYTKGRVHVDRRVRGGREKGSGDADEDGCRGERAWTTRRDEDARGQHKHRRVSKCGDTGLNDSRPDITPPNPRPKSVRSFLFRLNCRQSAQSPTARA